MRDSLKVKGAVTVTVFDQYGMIKRKQPGIVGRILNLPGQLMQCRHHNTITFEGDALMAELLLQNPSRPKVLAGSGFIQIGTGWLGDNPKGTFRCIAPEGEMRTIDTGFPTLKGAWGEEGANTVIYRATFPAGSLKANGINEACLLNGEDETAASFAYAELTPTVNMTELDTLQVWWEITVTGK